MEWWQALILGVVEGLTEYLPVSSTGHLILTQRAMGIGESEAADAYAICIQSGAILAVLGLYRRRLVQMGRGLAGRDREGWQLVINLGVAFGITAVIALTLERWVKHHLFNLPAIVLAWLVGGLAILGVVWLRGDGRRGVRGLGQRDPGRLEEMDVGAAAVIGLCQAVAIWPGTSRSLVTIVAGLLVGLSVPAAVEFSFLLGVITLLAATAKDAWEFGPVMVEQYSLGTMLLGVAVAWVSAAVAVKWMVGYLRRHSLAVFGWYRLILAAVVGGLMWMGKLT